MENHVPRERSPSVACGTHTSNEYRLGGDAGVRHSEPGPQVYREVGFEEVDHVEVEEVVEVEDVDVPESLVEVAGEAKREVEAALEVEAAVEVEVEVEVVLDIVATIWTVCYSCLRIDG